MPRDGWSWKLFELRIRNALLTRGVRDDRIQPRAENNRDLCAPTPQSLNRSIGWAGGFHVGEFRRARRVRAGLAYALTASRR